MCVCVPIKFAATKKKRRNAKGVAFGSLEVKFLEMTITRKWAFIADNPVDYKISYSEFYFL